jgi:Trypsin-like peptidase domain
MAEDKALIDVWKRAVVRVWAGKPADGRYRGTAFLIASTKLVTAKHVVTDENGVLLSNLTLSGVLWGGLRSVSECLPHPDSKIDIAVLVIAADGAAAETDVPVLPSRSAKLTAGTSVIFVGFSTLDKDVETPTLTVQSYDGHVNAFVLTPYIARGLSGGPALASGELVGVVWARNTDEQKSYLTPISSFKDFVTTQVSARDESSVFILHRHFAKLLAAFASVVSVKRPPGFKLRYLIYTVVGLSAFTVFGLVVVWVLGEPPRTARLVVRCPSFVVSSNSPLTFSLPAVKSLRSYGLVAFIDRANLSAADTQTSRPVPISGTSLQLVDTPDAATPALEILPQGNVSPVFIVSSPLTEFSRPINTAGVHGFELQGQTIAVQLDAERLSLTSDRLKIMNGPNLTALRIDAENTMMASLNLRPIPNKGGSLQLELASDSAVALHSEGDDAISTTFAGCNRAEIEIGGTRPLLSLSMPTDFRANWQSINGNAILMSLHSEESQQNFNLEMSGLAQSIKRGSIEFNYNRLSEYTLGFVVIGVLGGFFVFGPGTSWTTRWFRKGEKNDHAS